MNFERVKQNINFTGITCFILVASLVFMLTNTFLNVHEATKFNAQATQQLQQTQQEIQKLQQNIQELQQNAQEDEQFKAKAEAFIDSLHVIDNATVSYYAPYDNKSGICSDGNPNCTRTGSRPAPGTFAVDPAVIPLHSNMAIIYLDGTVEVGRALDTGGTIKGARVDAFRWTHVEAMDWGKKGARVIWL